MSIVLVTGASGFIGQHLVRRLAAEGVAVRGQARTNAALLKPLGCAEVFAADLRDPAAMHAATAGCDTVYHLAGKAHDMALPLDAEAPYRAANVEGTRNLLAGAVAGGVRRFVYFSSVKAMGEDHTGVSDESAPLAPTTGYGRSKLEAERLVLDCGAREGLAVTCLRPPLVYGAGCKGNLLRMLAAIDRGVFPPLPELGNLRSVVHVGNLVEAALLAGTRPEASGQCYIVADARPYSTRQLYELMCRGLGKRVPRWQVPLAALRALARGGDLIGQASGRRFRFDSVALAKLAESERYSCAKIERELGYCPALAFEDGLPELIAWYRATRR
ncbi:MAG TPA: NAD-dependent epimerase/dehydratase family protein [Chloroflexota bacterium]|jgi:nucleoside-diphosphate-sugar epimerase